MARPNLRRRVRMMWKVLPDETATLGSKVVVWIPKEYRGVKGVIVADHRKAQGKTVKVAPWDKYRVKIKSGGKAAYVVCSLEEMLPEGKSVKDVVG